MFEGFDKHRVAVNGVEINAVRGGSGPALLLLHGAPQSHVMWHKIAGRLAERFTVVATDLRGYGDSSKPEGLPDHGNYAKRVMAQDQVDVMRHFGVERFRIVAHDRGARVAHRLAIDHPASVDRLVVLDIAPTLAMYEQTSMEFARAYFHWFFLIQPAPFPETMINADAAFYWKRTVGRRREGLKPFTPEALHEYLRCFQDPATVHGLCEDYRASATIDLEHDGADRTAGRQVEAPMLALWAEQGAVNRCFKPLEEWRRVARQVEGHTLPCDHYIAEEIPEVLLEALLRFL